MKTKFFVLIAAIAMLTMAGCAASGADNVVPPVDEEIVGEDDTDKGDGGDGDGGAA